MVNTKITQLQVTYKICNQFDIGLKATNAKLSQKWSEVKKCTRVQISSMMLCCVKYSMHPYLATVSSLSKKSPSTIEISSMMRCLHFFHCWATCGLEASSTQFSMGALPDPIPTCRNNRRRLINKKINKRYHQYLCIFLMFKKLPQRT